MSKCKVVSTNHVGLVVGVTPEGIIIELTQKKI